MFIFFCLDTKRNKKAKAGAIARRDQTGQRKASIITVGIPIYLFGNISAEQKISIEYSQVSVGRGAR